MTGFGPDWPVLKNDRFFTTQVQQTEVWVEIANFRCYQLLVVRVFKSNPLLWEFQCNTNVVEPLLPRMLPKTVQHVQGSLNK
jgi:hypothetical protein